MENERPIEKLLRRYAKRRGEEAAAPLELHPANRRLLQGEVTRQYPPKNATTGATPGVLGWQGLWPRLVWALPILMVLTVGVWLVFEQGKPPPGPAGLAKADFQSPAPLSEDLAARSEAAAAAPLATRTTVTPDSIKPLPAAAPDALMVESSRPSPVVAPMRSTVPPPTSQAAPRADRSVASEPSPPAAGPSLGLRMAQSEHAPESVAHPTTVSPTLSPTRDAPPMALAPTPSVPLTNRYGVSPSPPAVLSQRFVQTPTDTAARRVAEAKAVQQEVLVSFVVEQQGNQLRVVDSDGSTYIGSIEPPTSGGFAAPAEARTESPAPGLRRQYAVTQTADDAQRGLPLSQAFNFRVTGTNRTLQQPVVFAGNILMPTNVISLQQTSPATGAAGVQSAPMQQLLPMPANSTLSGRLQLGLNPEMQINAVPVAP
ncbi:MAG: hypothetical protein KIS67_18530 [Verrucomicrobiae bacterium]|nr:hypothetical protein [Verrucomicrobiae bacterium]